MPLIWPGWRTESVDNYSGVLVPLEEAHLHSYSARCGRTEYEEVPDEAEDDDDDAAKDTDDEVTGMLEMSACEYSIEGLRKEVRRGEKERKWTDYECKYPISCQARLQSN
jgi:hypothetical protein